ncbi:hypothetical protein B5K08_09205 [Rhizobium leguminosarum bv. trifolii]|uniref:Uncharacterized protein n=1 Tax=Rhizobium leguminosarum bv. trifolii TaxID=386 RepID=A0A3E1BQW9_RHILT|nr:hypothetical protein [Rhizobium leguminosarum]RFB96535.1 hypothetical protein B5K08_09205 [Rhizobium leguminosarum bv. trifolii]RFB96658.1 hypothetical protein B5K10_09190 [Rhizobium leguminosarum bv. trifolii]
MRRFSSSLRGLCSMASMVVAAQLGAAGFRVELDVEPDVGHTISPAGGQRALSFLKKSLA